LAPPASAIEKLRLVGGKTLDEMWKKKMMQQSKLVMKGLGFPLVGVLYLSVTFRGPQQAIGPNKSMAFYILPRAGNKAAAAYIKDREEIHAKLQG
jgi:hypothetical protein